MTHRGMTKKRKDKNLKDDEKSRLLAEQLQADRRQSKLPAAKKWESNYVFTSEKNIASIESDTY